MGLKDMFNSMKVESPVIRNLDNYLESLSAKDNERAVDVNAPSQIGSCLRARFYARTGVEKDVYAVPPRSRRIFDNGTKTHERLQGYLLNQGMLLMDEVPVVHTSYNIQGHTDGILDLGNGELGILEIKSINSKGFGDLIDAKEEHKYQGMIYAFTIESRRKYLQEKYKGNYSAYFSDIPAIKKALRKRYEHLVGGKKHTKEEKIRYQLGLHMKMDKILLRTTKPITKVIFLYENKDTQDLKEYVLQTTKSENKKALDNILKDCLHLNSCVKRGVIPPREGKNKSDSMCRWCDYKGTCWIV